ncbi:hypothetical protein vseg_000883 [Gypsophila vaccaria]
MVVDPVAPLDLDSLDTVEEGDEVAVRNDGEVPNPNLGMLKLEVKDVEDEISFWSSAVVCYIIGANPLVRVFEGYIKRLCWQYDIDKPWSPHEEFVMYDVKAIPTWVHLKGFELKFLGENCLGKIFKLVGKPIRPDKITSEKTMMGYVRYLVEMPLDGPCPDSIQFLDEEDQIHIIVVEYECKPMKCAKCKVYGHREDRCRRSNVLPPKRWRPMVKVI